MVTDVVLAWEVWELRFENPLSRIWLIDFMADISAIWSQRVTTGDRTRRFDCRKELICVCHKLHQNGSVG